MNQESTSPLKDSPYFGENLLKTNISELGKLAEKLAKFPHVVDACGKLQDILANPQNYQSQQLTIDGAPDGLIVNLTEETKNNNEISAAVFYYRLLFNQPTTLPSGNQQRAILVGIHFKLHDTLINCREPKELSPDIFIIEGLIAQNDEEGRLIPLTITQYNLMLTSNLKGQPKLELYNRYSPEHIKTIVAQLNRASPIASPINVYYSDFYNFNGTRLKITPKKSS